MKRMLLRKPKNRPLLKLSFLSFLLWIPSLNASESTVSLSQVLQSTKQFFPKVAIELQKKRKYEAKALSSEGAFDLRFSGKAQVQPEGFYQNEEVGALLEQPTKLWGTKIYGGWRWSNGAFPSYEGKRVTGSRGELRAGVEVPILRGGETDPDRTAITQAEASASEAEAMVGITINYSLMEAASKYWKWAASVQKVGIAKSLLKISMERQQWIETRVRLGDLPAMETMDNQRTILDRKDKLVEAERDLQQAALDLSLYYRDTKGNPILLGANSAPAQFPEPHKFSESEIKEHADKAALLRPEFRQLNAQLKGVGASEKLAGNDLWPTLDLYGEASQDLGNTDPTRDPTEMRAGLRIKIPLERRKAKGNLAAAKADRLRLEKERALLLDQIRIDVARAHAALNATFEQIALAKEQVEVNEKLVEGEQIRFKNGDSPIMIVNLRELNLGESRAKLVNAQARHQVALISLLTITGELAEQNQN